MQHENTLEGFLRLQLSSDAISALYLPSVLSVLTTAHFSSSPDSQLHKWGTRVTSLIQSKDAGARWAGVCLARRTGELKRELLVEYAQRWINLTLPLLSKPEPPSIWKATIDLLVYIFLNTSHLAEFRRQVLTPNVPKFSSALLELLAKDDYPPKTLTLSALALIIPRFPTLHRALTQQIIAIALPFLSGSFPSVFSPPVICAAAHLLVATHHTDGKVGAPITWRNFLESAIYEAWQCIGQLQGTSKEMHLPFTPKKPFSFAALPNDPLPALQIAIQRLDSMIILLGELFRANSSRPVLVPVADLATLALHLLRSTENSLVPDQDATRLQLEKQLTPQLVRIGCDLATVLAISLRQHVVPHATAMMTAISYHLEQDCSPEHRIYLLLTLIAILDNATSHSPILPSRLFRSIARILSLILPNKRAIDATGTAANEHQVKRGKGKGKAKGYEGEEILGLNSGTQVASLAKDEVGVILQAADAFKRVMRMAYLPASLHSLGIRMILALHSHILSYPPLMEIGPITSATATPYAQLLAKLVDLQSELSVGTAGYVSRALPLTMSMMAYTAEDELVANTVEHSLKMLDVLLHPRAPPPVRLLPHEETLMLWRKEEGSEEAEERARLGLMSDEDLEIRERQDTTLQQNMNARSSRREEIQEMEVEQVSMPRSRDGVVTIAQNQPPPEPTVAARPAETKTLQFGTFGSTSEPFSIATESTKPPEIPFYAAPTSTLSITTVGPSKRAEEPPELPSVAAVLEETGSDDDIPSIDMGSDSEEEE